MRPFDWFQSLALSGFQLRVQPVVGPKIEMKRHVEPAAAEENTALLRKKWLSKVQDRATRNRILSYLDLEDDSAWHYRRDWRRMLPPLVRSVLRTPRLSLHTSPVWFVDAPPSK